MCDSNDSPSSSSSSLASHLSLLLPAHVDVDVVSDNARSPSRSVSMERSVVSRTASEQSTASASRRRKCRWESTADSKPPQLKRSSLREAMAIHRSTTVTRLELDQRSLLVPNQLVSETISVISQALDELELCNFVEI